MITVANKQILALPTIFLILATVSPSLALATVIHVSLPDAECVRGDTVSIPIEVDSLPLSLSVTAYGIDIRYDGEIFDSVWASASGSLSQDGYFIPNSQGDTLLRVAYATTEVMQGSGVLFWMKGIVKSDVPSGSVSDLLFTKHKFNEGLPCTTTDGSLLVTAKEVRVELPGDSADVIGEGFILPVNILDDPAGLGIVSFELRIRFDGAMAYPASVTGAGTICESWGEPRDSVILDTLIVTHFGSAPLTGSGGLVYVNYELVGSGAQCGDIVDMELVSAEFNDGNPLAAPQGGPVTLSILPETPPAPTTSDSGPCPDSAYTITWRSVGGATGYVLFENDVEVYSGSDTTEEFTRSSGDFFYSVVAENGCGQSGRSAIGGLTSVPSLVDAAPSGLSPAGGSQGPRETTFSWQPVPNAIWYEIVIAQNQGFDPLWKRDSLSMNEVTYTLLEGVNYWKVRGRGRCNDGPWVEAPGGFVDADNSDEVPNPGGFHELFQNSPNPFNPSTEISYYLPKSGWVTLDVYDITGRRVCRLVEEWVDAGYHVQPWDGRNSDGRRVSSGMYFYRLATERFTETKKMLLLK